MTGARCAATWSCSNDEAEHSERRRSGSCVIPIQLGVHGVSRRASSASTSSSPSSSQYVDPSSLPQVHYDADSAASASEASTNRRRRASVGRKSCFLARSASSSTLDQRFLCRNDLAGVDRSDLIATVHPAVGKRSGLAEPSAFLAHLEAGPEPGRQFVMPSLPFRRSTDA